jgi:predicted RNase H-like HicB family nuclease
MQNAFQARVWILIERADDVAGEWVAHCLDFDVIAQGTSLHHAFEMAKESVEMVVIDDLERGADPRARRAPDEHWKRLSSILDRSEKASSSVLPADESKVAAFAAECVFFAMKVTPAELARHHVPVQRPPVVEMAYALPGPEQRVA